MEPALTQAVDQQSWDPSVKALTQFPSVLDNLAHNLSWTSSLGQAFSYQQSDVMAAVQTMRAKAQAAGTLQSTSQITVTQPSANTIVIQPANPQVVYVPQYNPAVVYGAPVAVPLYVPPAVPVASAGLYFGSGVAVGAVVAGGGWGGGWGWNAWNVNWGGWGGGGSTIIYNNNTYINNRTWNNTTAITPGALATILIRIVPAWIPTTARTAHTIRTVTTVLTAAGTTTFPARIRPISRMAAITAIMA